MALWLRLAGFAGHAVEQLTEFVRLRLLCLFLSHEHGLNGLGWLLHLLLHHCVHHSHHLSHLLLHLLEHHWVLLARVHAQLSHLLLQLVHLLHVKHLLLHLQLLRVSHHWVLRLRIVLHFLHELSVGILGNWLAAWRVSHYCWFLSRRFVKLRQKSFDGFYRLGHDCLCCLVYWLVGQLLRHLGWKTIVPSSPSVIRRSRLLIRRTAEL